jgi:hypothetical protein
VFIFFPDEGLPHAEQLAAFKREKGIASQDHLVVVAFQ